MWTLAVSRTLRQASLIRAMQNLRRGSLPGGMHSQVTQAYLGRHRLDPRLKRLQRLQCHLQFH
jgi:hypothetical protein